MAFDIDILDLGLFSAVISVVLFITSEVIVPYYGKRDVLLKSKSIRHTAIGLGILFIIIAIFKIITSIS
ncbi:MAG: hypothetical protein KatS3mg003_1192 [Candidatus Nitrosocaldaceae archaeon]|nr:MAG: hypothetical protein KatS3mg003_1192 [Candidatus Nitrosocaldaceae archaeon]